MLSLSMVPFVFLQAFGEPELLKVMFFGDSLVSGIHDKDTEICPFRYDFLRRVVALGKEVQVIGTNADPEGTCQALGEGLDVHNNGYQDSGTEELLDYVTSDIQYLHKPVDYIFSSLGTKDCLNSGEETDYQLIAQSIRRIMGRLLNINDNAKILHIPIILPPSAGELANKCMTAVNQKLRDVYADDLEHSFIALITLPEQKYSDDRFYKLGDTIEVKPENTPPVVTPEVPDVVVPTPEVTPEVPVVDASTVAVTPDVTPEVPDVVATAVEETDPGTSAGDVAPGNTRRRFATQVMFLPDRDLVKDIVTVLINGVDWDFRAHTPWPTPEVTKEPDYYGYDWCVDNYEKSVCFEYYYGYAWCLENYKNDECYSYYYGDYFNWNSEDNYKWCLNFYDDEYCSFAYLGGEPDTWDWLSFGYHDCMKEKDTQDCFELYYGYAWCLSEYDQSICYDYYYGSDFEWNSQSLYKWCLNFYTTTNCSETYLSASHAGGDTSGNVVLALLVAVIVLGGMVWLSWKKFTCFQSKNYSKLNRGEENGEDEVELL